MDQGFGESPAGSQSNTLGLVGFILAFCLSPVGLLLSVAALSRQPRGLAIGGVVVGALGCVAWVFGIMGIIWAVGTGKKVYGGLIDYQAIMGGLSSHYSDAGEYPATLDELGLDAKFVTDPWETAYRYERPTADSFVLTSAGPDASFDTPDDVVLESDMSDDKVSNAFGEAIGRSISGQ